MSFTQNYIRLNQIVTDTQATFRQTQENLSEQHSWTVLDDPSFRRLLRDGHRANATVDLVTQLQDNE
jgi:hypothetical protein